jgi:hypothetical protein
VVLDTVVSPALYKNVSFLITIFVMTPQWATIKKCDFLCVLKDFSFENQGEVDSSPTDLSITFSIVGENPDGAQKEIESKKLEYKVDKDTNKPSWSDGVLNNLGNVAGSLF